MATERDHEAARKGLAEREQAFFDAKRRSYVVVRRLISRAIGAFNRSEDMHAYYDPSGLRVLDYGCGEGRHSFLLLERGARHVTGIDVSEVRVGQAVRRAGELGVSDSTTFLAADAHATPFEAGSFDLIVGANILHHLEFERAIGELRRLLKPGGRAVFVEPLAHNPILRLGRTLTPSARTPDEHPLTIDDWKQCGQTFARFRHYERELTTIPLMPLNLLLPRTVQRRLAALMARVDDALLEAFPRLRRYARLSILVLE